jgi:hypothetical protein
VVSNLTKIHPAVLELFHAFRRIDGWMDGKTDGMKICNRLSAELAIT